MDDANKRMRRTAPSKKSPLAKPIVNQPANPSGEKVDTPSPPLYPLPELKYLTYKRHYVVNDVMPLDENDEPVIELTETVELREFANKPDFSLVGFDISLHPIEAELMAKKAKADEDAKRTAQ